MSVSDYERRTCVDIVFEKRVEHVDAEIKHCPCCHHVTKGQFPSDLAGPVQCGLGIKAYILNLLITQMVSLNRVQKLLKTLIGRAISEAVMHKYILQLHVALEGWEQDAIRQLLASPVMHVDETGPPRRPCGWIRRITGCTYVLPETSHSNDCMPNADQLRWTKSIPAAAPSSRAMEGSSFTTAGPPISAVTSLRMDCADHICSGSSNHRGRPGIDSNGYAWAKNMKRLLKETCAKVSARKRTKAP